MERDQIQPIKLKEKKNCINIEATFQASISRNLKKER